MTRQGFGRDGDLIMDVLREKSAEDQATPGNIVQLDRPRAEGKADPRPSQSPEAKAAPAAPAVVTPAPPKKRSKARLIVPVLLLGALGGGGWYGYDWWINGRFMVETDDAYVQADVSTLGIKVAGYIASVPVQNGDSVKAGDVIVKLDDKRKRKKIKEK